MLDTFCFVAVVQQRCQFSTKLEKFCFLHAHITKGSGPFSDRPWSKLTNSSRQAMDFAPIWHPTWIHTL